MLNIPCPCNPKIQYLNCCRKLHIDNYAIGNPEQIMRSRYSAFVFGLKQYLLDTWHISTRPKQNEFILEKNIKWLGLEVKFYKLIDEKNSVVNFVARSKIQGKAHRLEEHSTFILEKGRWYYVDGKFKIN